LISVPLTVISDAERIAKQREQVCVIAREWLGTAYHHMGRVKGAGVDCAMFPLEVYRAAGIVDDIAVPYYPRDWMMHRSDEVYLAIVQRYAREISPAVSSQQPVARPGDFVLYHFGRCWSHGAIVLDWPLIIHALTSKGVLLANGEREGCLVGRARRFFSPWR
jgi:cell wall-associated NlpC family hydrolase